MSKKSGAQTRRDFLKSGAMAATTTLAGFSILRQAYALEADPIRVGVIGCGGRGTGAAENCIEAAPNVHVVALADIFRDRLDKCRKTLTDPKREGGPLKGFEVNDDHCFVGFDSYRRLLETDVDMVILATPPVFRPIHFEAAIRAGKHVFAEKPIAVDTVGVRKFMAAGELARQKGLAVVAGTHRRHDPGYVEGVKRIQDGRIGEIMAARAFFCMGGLWKFERQPGWTDMEYHLRNWYYYDWLSGDHIVEQHVHNLDVTNWVLGAHPVKAFGVGGKQVRTEPIYGNTYDHFAIDFEYESGVHLSSMARQWHGTDLRIGEFQTGTAGTSQLQWQGRRYIIRGQNPWKYDGPLINPYVQEHTDLITSIRRGEPLNEAQNVAESTLTAIMGREAAYTGLEVAWDEMMASDMDLPPDSWEFGEVPKRSVPRPGKQS